MSRGDLLPTPPKRPERHTATEIDSGAPRDGEQGGFRVVQTKVGAVGQARKFANGDDTRMAELTVYAASPFAFVFRYIRLRPISHAAILTAVLAAVGCSVGTQYLSLIHI